MLVACVVAGNVFANLPNMALPQNLNGYLARINIFEACRWICDLGRSHSLRSLVVERQPCKLKVLGSIPSGGFYCLQIFVWTVETTPVGFEPTRAEPTGLAGRRLNHSAKVSLRNSTMRTKFMIFA